MFWSQFMQTWFQIHAICQLCDIGKVSSILNKWFFHIQVKLLSTSELLGSLNEIYWAINYVTNCSVEGTYLDRFWISLFVNCILHLFGRSLKLLSLPVMHNHWIFVFHHLHLTFNNLSYLLSLELLPFLSTANYRSIF